MAISPFRGMGGSHDTTAGKPCQKEPAPAREKESTGGCSPFRPQGRILLGHGLAEAHENGGSATKEYSPPFDESGPPFREGRWTGRSHSFSCSSSHWGSWDRFNKTPSAPAARKVSLARARTRSLSWGGRASYSSWVRPRTLLPSSTPRERMPAFFPS